jgi:hypothetical protein
LRCRLIFTLMAASFVVPAIVRTQTSRVALNGTVSETVTLSVAPGFSQSNVDVVSSGGNTVRITASGDDPVIRVPLLVRSNSSFKISAESQTAELSQLMVTDVHATGSLVSPHVVNAIDKRRKVDLNVTGPFVIASGPRVSLGGTLNSPNNALQITLLIRLNSQPSPDSPVQLTFVATAGSPVQ